MFRKAQDLGLGLEVQDEFSEKIKESNQHPQPQGTGLNIQKQPTSSISRYRFNIQKQTCEFLENNFHLSKVRFVLRGLCS